MSQHQAGRLDQARKLYLRELKFDPDNVDALHYLGTLLYQQGDPSQAMDLIKKALAINPAIAEAYSNLGAVLAALGKTDEAVTAHRRAIGLKPDFPAAHYNLGNALTALGKLEEAVDAYERAITIQPKYPKAQYNLGNALATLGRTEEAVAAYRHAVAARTDYPEAYGALASGLKTLGKFDEAVDCLRHAIARNPKIADWHNNLGVALAALGQTNEAVAAYHRAIATRPEYAEAHHNLGNAFTTLGKMDEALASYRRAIAINPDYADAHGALSLILLSLGELRQGFSEYRWRWKAANFPEQMPGLSCPLWEGENLSGKAILVHCEQGYGDSLQFIRYVKLLSRMADRVMVVTEQPLVNLFRSIPDIEVLTTYEDTCDFHIPLMCLPRLFGTTLDAIPDEVPYLAADSEKAAHWAERLSNYAGYMKVGLVWAGDSRKHDPDANAIDRRRSVTLQKFAPLAVSANLQFFSLQKGEPSTQAADAPHGMQLVDMTSDLHDFEDTAALVTNLDLVITVDTSVAHLTGALAKPVWILSRFDGCWRWLNGREDSPWYPTVRLFHQRAPGAWDEVIERLAAELTKLSDTRGPFVTGR